LRTGRHVRLTLIARSKSPLPVPLSPFLMTKNMGTTPLAPSARFIPWRRNRTLPRCCDRTGTSPARYPISVPPPGAHATEPSQIARPICPVATHPRFTHDGLTHDGAASGPKPQPPSSAFTMGPRAAPNPSLLRRLFTMGREQPQNPSLLRRLFTMGPRAAPTPAFFVGFIQAFQCARPRPSMGPWNTSL
jgi:hypothetical protein